MKERLIELIYSTEEKFKNVDCTPKEAVVILADYLIANGVRFEKKVYYIEPIEDCERCPKVLPNADYCKEIDLLYEGKHPKYSKDQDWEFMCDNCPHEVAEREYEARDEKNIGKTAFLTREEAEQKLVNYKSSKNDVERKEDENEKKNVHSV